MWSDLEAWQISSADKSLDFQAARLISAINEILIVWCKVTQPLHCLRFDSFTSHKLEYINKNQLESSEGMRHFAVMSMILSNTSCLIQLLIQDTKE